jgi:hypothetical protein
MRIDSAIITGSFSVNGDTFNDLGVFPSTGSNTFVGNQSIVGAVSASALTGSIDFTNLTNVPTLVSGSEQIVSILSPLNSFTASNLTTNTFTSSASARLNSIETITASNIARLTLLEAITGSLATTGSNTFIGTQTITGSLYISSDLIVQGSSSLQNITASAVSIGTNIINLNTANPAIRYAGLSIGDSGSIGSSGSFLYDSVQDEMIFVHRGANTTVTSSVVLMGPQTYDSIGNETYLTSNRIPKGAGNEHLADSNISDTGTLVSINSATASFSGSVGIGRTAPEFTLDVNGDVALNRTNKLMFAGPTVGDRSRSYITGDGNNNLFIYGPSNNIVATFAYTGNVGIGITNPTNAKLQINASGLDQSVSAVTVNVSGSGAFQRGVLLLNSNLNADESLLYMVGKEQGIKNAGQLYFHYAGSGSNSNRLGLGLYAVDDIVNIFASGRVSVNTITDSGYQFDVNGTGRFSGGVTISTSTSPGLDIRKDSSVDNRYLRLTNTQASAKAWDLINQTNANSNKFVVYNATDNVVALEILPAGAATFTSTVAMAGGTSSAQFVFGIGGIGMSRTQVNNSIWWNGGTDTNHVLWNDYYGGPSTRPLAGTGFDGIKWNVYRGIYIQGGSAGASPCLVIQNSATSTEDHTVALYASGTKRFETKTTGIWVNDTIQSPGNLIQTSVNNIYLRPASAYWTYIDSGNGLSTGAAQKINIGASESVAGGGLNLRGYGVADSSTNFGFILDRGTKIAWTLGSNGTTGEYIYSQTNAPYSVTIHSGGYNAIACPNTGNVWINYEAGNLGVGTDGPSYKLHVNGTAYATGAAGSLSDIRHKNNVVSTSKGLNEILQLNPVEFEWNEDKIIDKGMEGIHLGFIAQEVANILPNTILVEPNEEETLGIKYNELIPVLVNAIKELKAEIEVLKNK